MSIEKDNDNREDRLLNGGYKCHWCQYRHGGCKYSHPEPYCKEFKIGKCYSCKYNFPLNGKEFTEEETNRWFKRGCETYYPSSLYCKKRKRLGRKRKKKLKKMGLLK